VHDFGGLAAGDTDTVGYFGASETSKPERHSFRPNALSDRTPQPRSISAVPYRGRGGV